ncbi:WD40 repeat-like protein [Dissoconium aciculare CBS 342.82]|uniref:WD40 repeat-like protein n=1 Tax=Dissoconium aciculare CBS 342.82 TaxID=1314786 RepID=A0A6J3MAB9_9PEZI|nr:WD40 repeat-like protein [Dissoconium aciculare CBS 342.82]KAF1824579.1 WD40 repeat-like protein [Dissoconium aciculare CBS 342.82]
MSSFFTLPASQAKRKRQNAENSTRQTSRTGKPASKVRDESISGSDISDDDHNGPTTRSDQDGLSSDSDGEEFANEVPSAKRLRLAEQYLANTQREVLDEAGFDAADIDAENLAARMGERLKEDTAETKGRLYRWIADDFDWTKAERAQFRHHQKSVNGVAIAGKFAYTVGKDGIIVKWELAEKSSGDQRTSRKPRRVLVSRRFGQKVAQHADDHTSSIYCVAASQDGRFVATGGADRKLIIWDAATLKPLKVFPQHRDAVTSLAFRRGTNQLFSASKDRTVKTWSLNELTYVETLFGHQDEVVDVSALTEEKCVTVGARDRTARLWKVVEESQLVFRGGGAQGKSRSNHRHGNVSDVEMAEVERHHEGSTDRVACIDEETFVTGSDNGSLSLWNIYKKKAVFTLPLAHGLDPPLPLDEVSAELNPEQAVAGRPQARWITALRAIPFSNIFVTGSWDGYVRVWKISTDKRRIESLGRVGSLTDGTIKNVRVEGIINDLAIIDVGDRASDGVIVIAAVGKSHRLGNWKEYKEGKNYAVLFEIPRLVSGSTESDANTEDTTQTIGHSVAD